MDDEFLLPVAFKGDIIELETRLLPLGYTYRFEVQVDGVPIQFEPDEERSYRALIAPEAVEEKSSKLNIEFLRAIAEALKQLHG